MDMRNEPRLLAAEVLSRVEKYKAYANISFDAVSTRGRIPIKTKKLGKELLFGVLRNRTRLEKILGEFLKHPLRKSHPFVRYQLLIAAYQLLYLDNIPAAVAVDRAVELVKLNLGSAPAKFVNAVLRELIRAAPFTPVADLSPVETIAQVYSYPLWIAELINRSAPEGEAVDLARALNQRSRTILRANTLKNSREELRLKLMEASPESRFIETEHSPFGLQARNFGDPIRQPLHRQGDYLIQDTASQLIGPYVDPRPGQRVLDACAGTGGKTLHMAALMEDRGEILSVDMRQSKMDALNQRVKRVGTSIVTTRVMDLAAASPEGAFDRILLDAPCSGLGVLRRHPEAKWRLEPSEIQDLLKLQEQLLDNMVPLLAPGGILVYVVCTFNARETREQVKRFIERHPNFEQIGPPEPAHGVEWFPLCDDQGALSLWTHRHDSDGFYAARFRAR